MTSTKLLRMSLRSCQIEAVIMERARKLVKPFRRGLLINYKTLDQILQQIEIRAEAVAPSEAYLHNYLHNLRTSID